MCGGYDGLVNPIPSIVCQLDQEQHLRERVVLAGDAFGQPAARDLQNLRKQPRLGIPIIVAEIFLQDHLGEEKSYLLLTLLLEVVQSVDARLSYNRRVFRPSRNISS